MTEREAAVQFHRELLDLAVAAGDRDSFERLLLDLFDRGAQYGIDAERQQARGAATRELAATRQMFEEAVQLAERRARQLDQLARDLAAANEQIGLVNQVRHEMDRQRVELEASLDAARAELGDLQLRLVDARVAS